MITLEMSLRGLLRNFGPKVGHWVGMTRSRNQFGERDVSGGITKAGDVNLRRALCQAATVMVHEKVQKTVHWTVFLTIGGRSTWLRNWATQVASRHGAKRAMVSPARRISVILHRMWVDDALVRTVAGQRHARQ